MIMNKTKFLKTAIFVLLFSFIITSCGPTFQTATQQTRIGMSREDVVSMLGTSYEVVSMVDTPEGALEVIRYRTTQVIDGKIQPDKDYVYHFLNNKLVEFNSIDLRDTPVRPSRPRSTDR